MYLLHYIENPFTWCKRFMKRYMLSLIDDVQYPWRGRKKVKITVYNSWILLFLYVSCYYHTFYDNE